MKNLLLFTFCLLISGVAFGQVNENFDVNFGSSYGDYSGIGVNGDFDLVNGLSESGNAFSGRAVRFRNNGSPSLTYVGTDGNGKDGGVGTVSFQYRHWDGDGSSPKFQVEYSTDGGSNWTNIGVETDVTSTTYTQFSESANVSGNDILVRIRVTNTSERIIVDDVVITDFGGAVPDINLTAISGNTSETGTTATFDVTLNTQPATDVVLNVSSGNTAENTVSPMTLTFTNANYNTPQTVTVTGVDDMTADGDQTTTITVATDDGLSDDDYDGLSEDIDVINEDDECGITGVMVSSTSCNGDDAEFVVTWTVANGSGTYEVDIDGNGYQTLSSGGTYVITGPTSSAMGVTVTVRDANETTCMGTTTVDIPECPLNLPDVVITEVADPSDNTDKRMVEVCNRGTSPVDITGWVLNGDFNGNTTVDFTVGVSGSVTLNAGECYVFANNNFPTADLASCVGFTLSGSISTNGNESFWLNDGTQDIDFYDGITLNFGDSEATRNGGVTSPNPTFNASEWTVASITGATVTPCNDATLPVELLFFDAKAENQTAVLSWSTATEENNAYFDVQRSTDGINFETIGQVEGAGTTYDIQEYAFIDENPVNGVNYYRLRQVDFDGQFENHKIVMVNINGLKGDVAIIPTQVRNQFDVVFTESIDATVEMNIVSVNGQVVKSTIVNMNGNRQTVDVAELNAGVYFIRMNVNNTIVTKRFVKF